MLARVKAKSQLSYIYFLIMISGWVFALKFYSRLKELEEMSASVLIRKSGDGGGEFFGVLSGERISCDNIGNQFCRALCDFGFSQRPRK